MADNTTTKVATDYFNVNPKTRITIMFGLMLGVFVSMLDSTIVATALPSIFMGLGGTENLAWLVSAYLLAQTIMMPIAGKLSDIYGRKNIFISGMIIFMFGSILAGLSNSLIMLIVCRAIQGLGGGIINPVIFAAVADFYGPKDRGKIQGLTSALNAIAAIVGPFVGAFIVTFATWQWIFYVNIPIGILAIALTSLKFPKIQIQRRHDIDYFGISILSPLILLVLLIFTWGGSTYAWASIEIIGMSTASIALLSLFVWVETKVKEPVIPPTLFKENVNTLCFVGYFILGLCMYVMSAFVPSLLQNAGVSAMNSGIVLITASLGLMVSSTSCGYLLKRTGYKLWMLVGPPTAALGFFSISTLYLGYSFWMASIYTFVAGLGIGFIIPAFMVAVQNVTPRKDIGAATSSLNLFRNIGGTIGLTLLYAIINGRMGAELAQNLPTDIYAIVPHTTGIIDWLKSGTHPLLLPYHDAIITSYGNSVCFGFVVAAITMLLVLIASIAVKNVPLKTIDEYRKMSEQDEMKSK